MTPEETALLQEVGLDLISDASQMVLISIAYALAVTSLLHRKLTKNPAVWAVLVAVGVTFAMTTVYTASWFQGFFKGMHVLFEENTEDPLATRIDLANQSITGVNNLINVLAGQGTGSIALIGDTVSVWRAWAILTPNRKPVYGLILLLLAGLGTSVAGNILDMSAPNFITFDSVVGVLTLLGQTLPLVTNLVATGLIAYKAYFMKATLGLGQSKVAKILMVVTESGAFYCVIQAINVALNLTDNTSGSLQDQVTILWNQFTLFVSRSIADALQSTQGSGAVSVFRHNAATHISFVTSMRGTQTGQDSNTEGLNLATHHSNRVEVEERSEGKEEGKWERHDVV
ncbi:hypothetical protein B0H10DRAFT_2197284 [Mycena sp. CBHHK59/15]|nr:hypothetical protein B0H10DRAFT_2197284 [Mycena sp. CBHHK59/15]